MKNELKNKGGYRYEADLNIPFEEWIKTNKKSFNNPGPDYQKELASIIKEVIKEIPASNRKSWTKKRQSILFANCLDAMDHKFELYSMVDENDTIHLIHADAKNMVSCEVRRMLHDEAEVTKKHQKDNRDLERKLREKENVPSIKYKNIPGIFERYNELCLRDKQEIAADAVFDEFEDRIPSGASIQGFIRQARSYNRNQKKSGS